MAAELVQDPSILHTFEHDLESVFWVLLWMTLLYMETTCDVGTRSSVLNSTMNPAVYMGSGGMNKLNFMRDKAAVYEFKTPNSPGMRWVLMHVHGIFHKRLSVPEPSDFPPPETNGSADESLDELNVTKSTSATETIQSDDDVIKPEHLHYALIDAISQTLEYKNYWSEDDASKRQEVVVSADAESRVWSGSKRSRVGITHDSDSEPQAKRSC
jgi:hypothetical protein